MRSFLLPLIAAFALASTAVAFEDPPAATPEMLRAEAERMIGVADAAGIFVAEDATPGVGIRHPRSGLLCRFAYGGQGGVSLVPSESLGVARGDDVACTTQTPVGVITVYATRYPEAATEDEAFESAIAALRQVHGSAEPVDLATLEGLSLEGREPPPASRSAAFFINIQGQRAFTRVSVYVANGWEYKLRFTAPTERANLIADIVWYATLTQLAPPAEATL